MIGYGLLECFAKDCNLSIVPGACRLALALRRKSVGKGFERIEIHMLLHGMEFGGTCLENFLSDECTNNSYDWGQVTSCLISKLSDDLLIYVSVEFFSNSYNCIRVLSIAGFGEAFVLRIEFGECLKTYVERCRTIELSKIGDKEFWALQGLFKGFLNANVRQAFDTNECKLTNSRILGIFTWVKIPPRI